jgi:hypothetical protein
MGQISMPYFPLFNTGETGHWVAELAFLVDRKPTFLHLHLLDPAILLVIPVTAFSTLDRHWMVSVLTNMPDALSTFSTEMLAHLIWWDSWRESTSHLFPMSCCPSILELIETASKWAVLQTLSVEPNFGKNLNKKFEAQETLPQSIRLPDFRGTYADYLIIVSQAPFSIHGS